jgi:hypothetical protein
MSIKKKKDLIGILFNLKESYLYTGKNHKNKGLGQQYVSLNGFGVGKANDLVVPKV